MKGIITETVQKKLDFFSLLILYDTSVSCLQKKFLSLTSCIDQEIEYILIMINENSKQYVFQHKEMQR